MGCHALLQGIFPTQGSNLGLLHWQVDSSLLSPQGSPHHSTTTTTTKLHQWCPTLCDPTRLPHPWDSPGKNTGVGCHFLLQCVKMKSLSRVQPSATPWTAAYQAPPSMAFSRQEYWSGVPLPSPAYLLGDFKFPNLPLLEFHQF